MLSLFRKGGVAQMVIAAVVFLIIVVFVLEFRAGRGPAANLSQECAVTVYDSCIDAKEFYAAYGLIVPMGMPAKQIRRLNLRKLIADGLVERELLIREADRLGLSISEQEVDDELAAGRAHVSLPGDATMLLAGLDLCIPDMSMRRCEPGTEMLRLLPVKNTKTQEFDYKIYSRIVRNTTNRSPKEFKEMQRRELIADRMRDLVRTRARVAAPEAFAEFARERSKAVVRTVALKRSWFAKYTVDTSDVAVDKWAAENKAQVDGAWKTEAKAWQKGCPVLREILLPFAEGTTDEDKKALRDKLDEALAKIKKGESFESAARRLDSGPTAMVGGELGCIGDAYGAGKKELLDAAEKLKEHEVSPVIETDNGFHVIQLEKRLGADEVETVGRRTVARGLYVRFAADERLNKFAADLIDRARKGQKLDEATDELTRAYLADSGAKKKPKAGAKAGDEPPALSDEERPKVEISAPFTMDGDPIPDALPSESVAAQAFDLAKVDAVYDKPIATSSGAAVMQLKELDAATQAEFDKDRARWMRMLRAAKENDALSRFVEELRAAAKDKVKVDARFLEEAKGRDEG